MHEAGTGATGVKWRRYWAWAPGSRRGIGVARALLPTAAEDANGSVGRRLPSALARGLHSCLRRGRPGPAGALAWRRAVGTALVMSFATVFGAAAQADRLVSHSGQSDDVVSPVGTSWDHAQGFETGTTLDADSTYYVVVEGGNADVDITDSDAEDSLGESDWSILEVGHYRQASQTGAYLELAAANMVRVNSTTTATSTATSTQREIWSATLTVGELTSSGSTVGYGYVNVGGGFTIGALSDSDLSFAETRYGVSGLTINVLTDPGLFIGFDPTGETVFDSDEFALEIDGTEFSFGDATFDSLDQFTWTESGLSWGVGDTVAVKLLGPAPPPPSLVSATVSETALTLTYDKNLDEDSVPAAGAYAVAVDGTAATVSSVAVDGVEATLTLASAPTSTATSTVGYVVPATNPLRSLSGVNAPAFAGQPVAHATDLVKNRDKSEYLQSGAVGLLSGSDYVQAQGFDTGGNAAGYLLTSVALRLSQLGATDEPEVGIYTKSGSDPGDLVYALANPSTLADGWLEFTAPPGAVLEKDTDYFVQVAEAGTGVFSAGLTASDSQDAGRADGWSIANSRRQDEDGTWSSITQVLHIHIKGAIIPNRLATGAPAITGTAEEGETLTAATAGISDPDGNTKAEAGETGYAYTHQWIRVDSDGGSNATDISGATASTYVLAAADAGKKIKVEVEFIDDADNDEGPLASAAYPETGTVVATTTNAAPVFGDGAGTTRTFAETPGSTVATSGSPVGQPVAASDADNDPLEYSLEGADAGRFTVALGTGQIRTLANTLYDYEAQQSYEVVVKVEDGNGASDTIDVTLEVEDQFEMPRPVSPPTVTTLGTTSLRVNWTAPENVGRPTITGYDLRRRLTAGGGGLTERVTGTSETVTGLQPDTEYAFEVRAVNADGTSLSWSQARNGRTAPEVAGPLVRFGASSYTATEGGADATVTVELSEAVGSSTTIPLRPTNRGGATDADYTGVPPNVTFGASQTSTTFTVTAVDDSDNDRGESVRIGFGTLPSGVAAGSPATATVALEDNDGWKPPTVSFAAATYTATEGGGAVTVTVEVDRAEVPFTLRLTTDGQGGATSSDYSGVPSSVVFRGSDTAKSFTVTAVDDEVNDDGESVVIGIGAPLPEGLSLRIGSPSEATVRLVDNDVPSASGALRLVGGDGSYGRLQVYHDGQWGLVCEGNFGREEAQVACRQLGFADGEGFGGAGSGGLPFWLKGVQCQGTESRLVNCSHRGLQEHSCGSFDITGVECSRTPLSVMDARVSGALLTLVYDAALDGSSTPSGGDFVVLAGPPGSGSAVPVTAVSVADDTVALTLARGVLPDEAVRLSYLVAPMHPVQDASGVPAAPLADTVVRNETPPLSADAADAVVSLAEIGGPAAHRPSVDLSPWLADGGASAPLGRLDLSSREVADLSALAGLTALRVLNLADNAVADLAPLSGLTGLRVLDLSSNAIADLGPLAGLTGLERLDLSGNRIADVSALSGLTGLEVLLLDGNRVADVLPLWSLQGLVHLGLSDNRIDEVGLLAELGSLKRLDLGGNRVSDISPLGDLSGLVWLRLPGNPVSDVAPLGRLTLLRWLWLDAGVTGSEALGPRAQRRVPLTIETAAPERVGIR